MRKLLMSVYVLLMALGLLGCSFFYSIFPTPTPAMLSTQSVPNQPAQELPKLTGDWHVSMAQTGGIAGVSRTLEISSSGEMTVINERSKKQTTTQLSTDKVAVLTELVASSKYQPISEPTGCADCFIYKLEISSAGEKFQAQLDDISLPDSGLQPLINFLGEFLKE
jgi:hypothetical protein